MDERQRTIDSLAEQILHAEARRFRETGRHDGPDRNPVTGALYAVAHRLGLHQEVYDRARELHSEPRSWG